MKLKALSCKKVLWSVVIDLRVSRKCEMKRNSTILLARQSPYLEKEQKHGENLSEVVHCRPCPTRKEYRQKLCSYLDQTEADRIRKLCHAAELNEKLFWKLVKSQRSSSQMSAFLVNGDLLTDKRRFVLCGPII